MMTQKGCADCFCLWYLYTIISNDPLFLIIIYNVDNNTLNQENLLFTCFTGPAIKMRQGFYTISTIINKKII